MKITLNLASKPYIDVRPIIKQLRILMAVFLLLALPLWLLLRAERNKAEAATMRVQAVEKNVRKLEQQQQSYQALMRQPQNAAVLTQSDFLNSLFRRKAFSWTATMTDLETVLPSGVQVLSIEPEVSPDGEVAIRLRVNGARDRAVELVRNLEKSRHFAYPRLAGEALATSTGPNQGAQPINASIQVNFDILADYRPLSEVEEKSEKATENKAGTDAESKNGENKTGDRIPPAKKPKLRTPGAANVPGARRGGNPRSSLNRRGEQ
ncbi:MAG: fimbrial assembly protein [Silvibacterium sp.]|nr:fimbrial assembly protein [Silvibacterium sp.]MBV8436535.1 fimbrial assembly protein [Silvibacterium sp.]